MSANHSVNLSRIDRDGDGFVDSADTFTLVVDGGELPLTNWKDRLFTDDSTKSWTPVRAISGSNGYEVLVQGEEHKKGLFRFLNVNSAGRINGRSKWQPVNRALKRNWEDRFGDVIQVDGIFGLEKDADGDGFLDAGQGYRMASQDGSVTLKNAAGKALSDKSSKRWDAIQAIGTETGFQVLLRQQGRKSSLFRRLDVNPDGTVSGKTGWKTSAKALFAGWDARFQSAILDDSSSGGGITAASVDELPPISHLIYTATATDLSELVYSLEPFDGSSLDGLSIDPILGEVRLTTEELIAIPERLQFRVVATDVAGNSSSLDVVVALTVETPAPVELTDEDVSASGDGAMVSMTSLDVPSIDDSDSDDEVVSSSNADGESDDDTVVAVDEDSTNDDSDGTNSDVTSISEDDEQSETDLPDEDPEADGLISVADQTSPGDDALPDVDEELDPTEINPDLELLSALRLDAASDTGSSDRDAVTQVRTPRFSGVATPGSRIELFAESSEDSTAKSTYIGSAPVDEDGEWQLPLSDEKAFLDGRYSITAQELNADGEELSQAKALELVVDGLAPEFTSAATASATLILAADALPPTDGVVFVSNDGSDSNPGSLLAPFRTIQYAIDNAKPGDVISIRGGTFRERLRIENLNGREDAPITFENYQNEDVVLTGAEQITTDWQPHDDNIWKTNLNFDISQLYLDGQMLTAARWPNITKEWDRLDDSDRRNATPESYWDIEGTRALALVNSELPDVYTNHESQQRLADLGFSVDGAMLVPHKSFGLTHSGEIINHKAGESSFDIDPNFELWLRSPGQKALKNFNWTSGNDGSVETADLWPLKNGPVQGTKQFHYHLEGHLGLLDRPQEWHYDKESGDLYVWLPDDQDPNLSDLQARAWDRSTSYIADPDQHPDADYHSLLEIKDSSFLDFKGIALHTGIFELNEATNLNFDQMRFLYPTYDGRMLKDGQRPLYNNRIQPVSLKGRPELENVPDSNISFINSEFANGISGFLRAAGPGLELKNSYLHNVRDRGALRVAAAPRMNVERNTFHTFGFGGGGKIGDSSVWRYNHIYAFHGDGDISGIQVPASSQEGSLVAYNWIHDAPGRNGIRFDGSPAGIRGTAHHNVSRQTRRGMRIKGDQHEIVNNTLVSNFSYDISSSRGKFYGYLDSTPGCLEWECRYIPSKYGKDPNRRLGHFNSTIHNNAFDRMPDPFGVGSPNQAIGNSYVSDHGQADRRTTLIKEELRDPENFDFRPREGSPLIDLGLHIHGVTDGYQGEAPDSGAYEFGADSYWIPGHRIKKARTPIAPSGSQTVKPDADLMWLEGKNVALNHIYFGEDSSSLPLASSQANNIFTPPEELIPSRTYYWRVDTEQQDGSIVEGDLWSFQVAEARPVMPNVLVRARPGDPLPIDPVSKSTLPLPDYEFYMGTYEVTNAQYAQFLNSVASVDDYYLYDKKMGLTDLDRGIGGITRDGESGDYSYSVVPELANYPVTYVSFWDAARYVNWLSTGSTEKGVYTMMPKQDDNKNEPIQRNQDAFDDGAFALPSHAEWLKAGLYSSASVPTLYAFPTQSDSIGVEQANIEGSSFSGLAPVGSFDYPSPHGTFDQAGNAWEWLDDLTEIGQSKLPARFRKGGSFLHPVNRNSMSSLPPGKPRAASDQGSDWGFRVVRKRTDNQPPVWKSIAWELDDAFVQEPYASSIADLAFDADGDPLSFSMVDGPGWLSVTPDGHLKGTPNVDALGKHSVVFRVEDSKGDSQTLTVPYTIKVKPDTNPPVQPATPELIRGDNAETPSSKQLTNHPSPDFKGTAEINSTVDLFLDDQQIGTVRADSSGQWSYTDQLPKLDDGVHRLTVRATDPVGNQSVASEPLVFTLDTRLPRITSADIALSLDENSGDNQLIYAVTSDDESLVMYSIDDTDSFSVDPLSGDVRFGLNPDHEDSQQPRSFVVTAHDEAGNSSEKFVRFEVNNVDDDPPKFTSGGRAKVKGALSEADTIYQATATDDTPPIVFGLDDSKGDSGYFDIDPETGVVVLGEESGFQEKSKYTMFVTAEDVSGNVSRRKVNVTVKNVNNSNAPGEPGSDDPLPSDDVTGVSYELIPRDKYTKKNAQIIKGFDPASDRLVIRAVDFGLENGAEIGIPKNKKMFKKLQNSDIDFISKANKKDVFILFNQNGDEPGLGDLGGVVAVIRNSPQFDHSQFTADLVEMI
ncbi:Ig-like domain-containing protein [Synechococcus sp. CC9616]|uniref:Ig-like domain-containing protein n=1 Tax=Synechococcus sp. CC9616 TaxID=110663 RepID=UPI0004B95064|nr:Ig-like domain-containing protein [Synechococcus sp. CC9616]